MTYMKEVFNMINFPNVFIRIVIPQCGWNRIFEIKPDSPDYRDFKNEY